MDRIIITEMCCCISYMRRGFYPPLVACPYVLFWLDGPGKNPPMSNSVSCGVPTSYKGSSKDESR